MQWSNLEKAYERAPELKAIDFTRVKIIAIEASDGLGSTLRGDLADATFSKHRAIEINCSKIDHGYRIFESSHLRNLDTGKQNAVAERATICKSRKGTDRI
ncbi:uncharacterized protein LOC124308905 [Neodiprion virginianus]|uniref:uncharacterized protein LOC124308905 n=1 Tax=Neodiprion virginianus TaxID=2961670 RepID=UPI001EE7044E|nr:uncharacterized protein LOC124308905 [Neodiprion virginianus]